MRTLIPRTTILIIVIGLVFSGYTYGVNAEETRIIDELQLQIEDKRANIDHLKKQSEEFRSRIDQKQRERASLQHELDLLDNRAAATQLDMKTTEAEIDVVNTELRLSDAHIRKAQKQLEHQQALLKDVLQKINTTDGDMMMQLWFGNDSFSELFDRMQQLEAVQIDLHKTLKKTKAAKSQLAQSRMQQAAKKDSLTDLHLQLRAKQDQLGREVGAKETLLTQTQRSEAQFQALLQDLREEQAFIEQQVRQLQGKVAKQLDMSDALGDSTLLSWPVDARYKGLSALFNDPTYPFRHLFEHSGVDIPQPQGTELQAAAPGYVAWTRTGRLYGNYIMIIHANGLATLYAHLSRINVKADQFVTRGEVIGRTGGARGTRGAGLSTGPHLHFEVRKDGIPVDPLRHLIDI